MVRCSLMIIKTVMEELAAELLASSIINVYDYVPKSIQAPAAIIVFPETMEFDATFGRGLDMMRVPVLVVISELSSKSAAEDLSVLASGSGVNSVKVRLEEHTPVSYHSLRVVGFRTDPITFNGVDYLSATFEVEIAGQGA